MSNAMPDQLQKLLQELERFGNEQDARAASRSERMLNITRDTGQFLLVLIRALRAQRVLEIGTSNGYSTLWLAHAVQPFGGRVTTLERSSYKIGLARENFARAGLQGYIDQIHGDAGNFLKQPASEPYPFIFLDSDRGEYVGWWSALQDRLAAGGMIVIDNATSHPREVEPLWQLVRSTRAISPHSSRSAKAN